MGDVLHRLRSRRLLRRLYATQEATKAIIGGAQIKPENGAILWGNIFQPIMKCRDTLSCCAKTDEPTDVQFGAKTRVGQRNHVIGGAADPPQ